MAERTPPGVTRYRPIRFDTLEPLIYFSRQSRFRFKADNAPTRIATTKDEIGDYIPEISLIWDFFNDLSRLGVKTDHTAQRAQVLNQYLRDLRNVSPLYVVMERGNEFRAGLLTLFTDTNSGVQPVLGSKLSREPGLPARDAIFAQPMLIQRTGPANLRSGRR